MKINDHLWKKKRKSMINIKYIVNTKKTINVANNIKGTQ